MAATGAAQRVVTAHEMQRRAVAGTQREQWSAEPIRCGQELHAHVAWIGIDTSYSAWSVPYPAVRSDAMSEAQPRRRRAVAVGVPQDHCSLLRHVPDLSVAAARHRIE